MYAVIETGGKQYRVEVGTELEVELLDVEPGKTITLERVLLVADGAESTIGRPLVADASVSAEVVAQTRGPKLISFKYRPKARSRVKKGHRQELTALRISDITVGGKSAAKSAMKAQDDAKTERQRLEEAATIQGAKDAELASKLALGSEAAPKPASKTRTARVTAKAAPAAAKPAKAAPKPASKTRTARVTAKAAPAAAKPAKAKATAAKPAKAAPAATKPGKAKATAAKPAKAAPAETKPGKAKATAAGPTTTGETPKRSRTKASAADPGASTTTTDAPKRSRATKKDE